LSARGFHPKGETKRRRLHNRGRVANRDQRHHFPLPQPHAAAAAVLSDELDAGGFQRATEGYTHRSGWNAFACFKTPYGAAGALFHVPVGMDLPDYGAPVLRAGAVLTAAGLELDELAHCSPWRRCS